MVRTNRRFDKAEDKNFEESSRRKRVIIDLTHQNKIVDIFLTDLKQLTVKSSDIPFVTRITNDMIIMNENVTLEDISATLGEQISSKLEFVRKFYIFNLDKYTDIAYNEAVTAIQEYPFSFVEGRENKNIIRYEFIQ